MATTYSFETSVEFRRTIWRYIPQDRNLYNIYLYGTLYDLTRVRFPAMILDLISESQSTKLL
jgi:hypothetical protein